MGFTTIKYLPLITLKTFPKLKRKFHKRKKNYVKKVSFTCWQIEIKVGVSALESGVVPRNLMMLTGRLPANQSSAESAALFDKRLVLPQPPSP